MEENYKEMIQEIKNATNQSEMVAALDNYIGATAERDLNWLEDGLHFRFPGKKGDMISRAIGIIRRRR